MLLAVSRAPGLPSGPLRPPPGRPGSRPEKESLRAAPGPPVASSSFYSCFNKIQTNTKSELLLIGRCVTFFAQELLHVRHIRHCHRGSQNRRCAMERPERPKILHSHRGVHFFDSKEERPKQACAYVNPHTRCRQEATAQTLKPI